MREKARVLAAPSHAFNLPYYLPYLDARVQAQGAGFGLRIHGSGFQKFLHVQIVRLPSGLPAWSDCLQMKASGTNTSRLVQAEHNSKP